MMRGSSHLWLWTESRSWRRLYLLLIITFSLQIVNGCQFLPLGEYLRFVRVPENLRVGEKIMTLEVLQKHNLTLESIDKGDDSRYFALSETTPTKVDLLLARSLENIVDNDSPQNILKFRIVCYPSSGSERTPSFLQFTAYIEDLNDHAPTFLHAPYHVTVDELTPTGLVVFRGISAIDNDKPNTGNSDVHFSIVDGNEEGKFGLESSHNPALVVKRNLDYDSGDREFKLKLMASDRGNPPLSSFTVVTVKVVDNDDLPVAFTKSVYKTQIKEFYPFKNKTIRHEVPFPTSGKIMAFDLDLAINSSVEYDIIGGNEGGYFQIDKWNGTLFLVKEVDREGLSSNVFNLQLRARQQDDASKMGMATAEIEVLDLNDCLPQFEVDIYNISIMENLPNGFSVLHVSATDLDQGENADFLYKLEDRTKAFQIDPRSGWLTVRDQNQLDREKMAQINLKVYADEKMPNIAFGTQKSYATVEVHVLDANDANPTFIPSNLYKFQVTIDSEIGSVVGQVTAEDPDLNDNGKIVYDIQKQNGTTEESLPFEIDPTHGYIFLLERPLPKLHYTLLVQASDQPANPAERRYSLAVVQIDVVKAGAGHSPSFIGSPYEFWVGSHVGIGTSVGHVKVNHLDPKYTVYDLLHSYYEGVPFAIEERTGIIAVVDDLSKYTRTLYEFEAYVTDSRHTLTTNVTIHIVDPHETASASEGSGDNRNASGMQREPIELSVKENVGGAVVGNLKTLLGNTFRDVRGVEFVLANYDARDKFAISSDGTIYTLKPLDREEKARHLLTVISQNRGVIQGQGVYEIYIHVEDENDNSPKFSHPLYEAYVRENSPPGTPITLEYPIQVNDPDAGINAEFTLELRGEGSDKFLVHPTSGKIVVGNIPLDREEKNVYSLKLVATDTGGRNSSTKINIHIQDTNDNPPIFLQNIVLDPPELDLSNGPRELLRSSASQPISVEISNSEPIRIPETVNVGSRIARVLASDKDTGDNSKIFYRIVSENNNPVGGKFSYLTDKQYLYSRNKDKHFVVDRNTGEISVAKPLKPDTEYALNISASDRGGLRAYTGIKVVVVDVNDHSPKFDRPWYAFELLEGTYMRAEIGKVIAKDGDTGPNGEITYSLQPKIEPTSTSNGDRDNIEASDSFIPFTIDPKSGMIFVEGNIDRESRTKYSFYAVATDNGQPQMESFIDVDVNIMDVNDNPPKFHGYITTVKLGSKSIPVYRTTLTSNTVPAGTQVFKVSANDSDSAAHGNGLVLFHLANNYKNFYIDSKNGTISTLTKLEYEKSPEFNLTVVASDLGKPSLSSTAWVLIRLKEGPKRDHSNKQKPAEINDLERMFGKEVYTYHVPNKYNTPYFLTKMNVTERYRRYPTEYHLFGGNKIIENFRIGPKTGEIFVIKKLESGVTYDMLVRAFNSQQPSKFDIRQGSQVADRYLEHNEALIRVEMMRPPPPSPSPPSTRNKNSSGHSPRVVYKTTTTTSTKGSALTPVVIMPSNIPPEKETKRTLKPSATTPRFKPPPEIVTLSSSPDLPPYYNVSENEIITSTKKSQHNKNSYFYAGEIAVLTMSLVVFLGGLVAAISIACVRRRKRRRHGHGHGHHQSTNNRRGRLSHLPAIPVEVRLQKQALGSRPILFPMALPNEPLHHQMVNGESSDATSETYTDGDMREGTNGQHQRSASFVNVSRQNNNMSNGGAIVCPDCRKIRRPPNNNNNNSTKLFIGGISSKMRNNAVNGKRHPSLPSSNDSGIDGNGSDPQQCQCCRSSSESGRDQYEDSLMPHHAIISSNPHHHSRGMKPVTSRSFKKKRNANQTPYPHNQMHNQRGRPSRYHPNADGIVIL